MIRSLVTLASLFLIPIGFSKDAGPNRDFRQINIEVKAIDNRTYTAEAEFMVEAPYQVVWEVILDIDHMDQYMKNFLYGKTVTESDARILLGWKDRSLNEIRDFLERDSSPIQKRLKKVAQGRVVENYVVEIFNLPWPIKNRWVIFKCWDRAEDGFLTRGVKAVGGLMKGYGLWRVEPHPKNPLWTMVRFENTTILDYQVPKFIGKSVARYASRSASESVRDRAKKLALR